MRRQTQNGEELSAAIRTTWASITPQQCHSLIASILRHIAAVIHAKGALTNFGMLYVFSTFLH